MSLHRYFKPIVVLPIVSQAQLSPAVACEESESGSDNRRIRCYYFLNLYRHPLSHNKGQYLFVNNYGTLAQHSLKIKDSGVVPRVCIRQYTHANMHVCAYASLAPSRTDS